jgi:hypothetical protein
LTEDLTNTVSLQLARPSLEERRDDLWSTLDAAQYAVLMVHEQPASPGEEAALDTFEAVFSALVRGWEETSLGNKGSLIDAVATKVVALADFGLYVHWGVARRPLGARGQTGVSLPVTILSIDRLPQMAVTISLPPTIFAEAEAEPEDDAWRN